MRTLSDGMRALQAAGAPHSGAPLLMITLIWVYMEDQGRGEMALQRNLRFSVTTKLP